MHLPCGHAYGFGISATTDTPEAVLAGFFISTPRRASKSNPSAVARISWFFGILSRSYLAQTLLISCLASFLSALPAASRFRVISLHALENTESRLLMTVYANLYINSLNGCRRQPLPIPRAFYSVSCSACSPD